MFTERLKFYADTPKGEKNKLHCFKVSLFTLEDAYFRFLATGYNIRASWYEKIDTESGVIAENCRLNDKELLEKFISLKPYQVKKYQEKQQQYNHNQQ